MACGVSIELGASQGDLAVMVGCSRQHMNRAWRQTYKLDIVPLGHARQLVQAEAALAAVAEGRVLLKGAGRPKNQRFDQRTPTTSITLARSRRMPRSQRS